MSYNLNTNTEPYFLHQAGAYQRDAPYTDVPFFSPGLAKHCEGNSCTFAGWGTSAHTPTPFTSPIIYINKYTNCGGGIIEHTQMIHNFADPNDSNPNLVDQNYFNVGWGGVRSSSLPYALEADPATGAFAYDFNGVMNHYLKLCTWGYVNGVNRGDHDVENGLALPRGIRKDIQETAGYTTFAEPSLVVNHPVVNDQVPLPCRKPGANCYTNAETCMAPSCTDEEVGNGHVRMQLKVAAGSSPNCRTHSTQETYVSLKCELHAKGFGRASSYKTALDQCAPWMPIGLRNTRTGEVLAVAFVRHWSWKAGNKYTYLTVFYQNPNSARKAVNDIFDNTQFADDLLIDIVPAFDTSEVPAGYNPSSIGSFTYVYGKGEEYGVSVDGQGRRRVGCTEQGVDHRDFTVFTINWLGNIALSAGSTYSNRSFMFQSNLGNVKATAENLVPKVMIDHIEQNEWNSRNVDVYTFMSDFVVNAALEQGDQTGCENRQAVLACEGKSTPSVGVVPFFYITCGSATYFGSDPYHFAPPFDNQFPDHGSVHKIIRSYVCKDESDLSVRPTWKLMGFFNKNTCTSLSSHVYNKDICEADEGPLGDERDDLDSDEPSSVLKYSD